MAECAYDGGCHCGRVRFRVMLDLAEMRALDCDCSICRKKGFVHAIVPSADFELLAGDDALTTYAFGTHVAQHRFCATCGMHPFYTPRSHPEDIDVNLRCLDEDVLDAVQIQRFDGQNWEASVSSIRQAPEAGPMVERMRVSTGTLWEDAVGYSRAVRDGESVFVTGTTATREDGTHADAEDAYAQAVQILANIERALAALDAELGDVVRTRIFVTDIESDWRAVGRAHAEVFGETRPATTMVEVRRLIAPWMRVEIEADAIVR